MQLCFCKICNKYCLMLSKIKSSSFKIIEGEEYLNNYKLLSSNKNVSIYICDHCNTIIYLIGPKNTFAINVSLFADQLKKYKMGIFPNHKLLGLTEE